MIIWGGYTTSPYALGTGGLYDPATDTWEPMSDVDAPSARFGFPAVWTGSRLLVWGGRDSINQLDTGGRYDPSSDTWTPTSMAGVPSARSRHTTVWTGSRLIVWGGGFAPALRGDGALYDPVADTWETMSPAGAPSPRNSHGAAWAGGRMVIWGGYAGSATGHVADGGRYDPENDTWSGIATAGSPIARETPLVLPIGNSVMVWGGNDSGQWQESGALYDPDADVWSSLASSPPTTNGIAATSGDSVFIWASAAGSMARYDALSNTWTASMKPYVMPVGNPLWTGEKVLFNQFNSDTGFSYDPQTDLSRSFAQFPLGSRSDYTRVWTGSRMIVWGGFIGSPTNTGEVYDPVADSWTPTSLVGAPSPRLGHTAVWTGSRMVIWGGHLPMQGLAVIGDGAMYDPVTDSWTPVAASGAPMARTRHTAVWTGSKMIVWGGVKDFVAEGIFSTDTGAQFDPQSNTWSAMSTTSAPQARYQHAAVWTGTRMIVWGGSMCFGGDPGACVPLDTGGRFAPSTNTWTPVGTAGTPPPPSTPTAVWTGTRMIIWGGPGQSALYSPALDSWTPVAVEGAPSSSGAAWTGRAMAVAGGLYIPSTEADADSDGYAICDGDCHDGIETVNPDGIEVCNGLDDDCSGVADDGGSALCGSDGDPCTVDLCSGHLGCTHGDADADEHIDEACGGDDCDDANGWTWAAPEEVTSLEVYDENALRCESQDLTAGPATRFDLVHGVLAGVGVPNFPSAVCRAAGVSSFASFPGHPDPGTIEWFLMRARNSCGVTSWGSPPADAGIPPCR